jgi:hypothetical protein
MGVFLDVWIPMFVETNMLRVLLSMAATILEKNCSDTILLQSKTRMLNAFVHSVIPAKMPVFPSHSLEECMKLQETLLSVGNGVISFCGLNPSQQQLLRDNDLGAMVLGDFESEYRRLLQRLYGSL